MVIWQSALPVRQALVRLKYGNETATSPEAKGFIEHTPETYDIMVAGLPSRVDLTKLQDMLKAGTTLSIKGKDPIHPSSIDIGKGERASNVGFKFSRAAAITLDDKEVEFVTKIGQAEVRYKFHLKDMVYNGKLEL